MASIEMGAGGAPDFFYKEAQRLGYVARSAFKVLCYSTLYTTQTTTISFPCIESESDSSSYLFPFGNTTQHSCFRCRSNTSSSSPVLLFLTSAVPPVLGSKSHVRASDPPKMAAAPFSALISRSLTYSLLYSLLSFYGDVIN